ncbi:MAG: autoinducer synthase [Marinosulfonomonas sp.]|nr:autoinducer synthase [Marinosulfonomonas sp.]
MLRYIYGNDLDRYPLLRDTMFRDRADQFSHRLKWDVSVDSAGFERDEYDDMNPLYAIWVTEAGIHGGSMRFLPTVGPTMVHDHFPQLTGGVHIESPLIWECTRFCLAPQSARNVTAGLVLAAGEIMENFHLSHFVGVFDPRMERIYRMFGLNPDVIGTDGTGAAQIGVGLWEMKKSAWPVILKRAGVSRKDSREWFRQSIYAAAQQVNREPEVA